MEIQHFSHDHPLNLSMFPPDAAIDLRCYACRKSISSVSYGCNQCNYFLHRSCAELPPQIAHHFHPEHSLTLRPNPPMSAFGDMSKCDVCKQICNRFIYHCPHCAFFMDINCASMATTIEQKLVHISHNHELIPIQKPALLVCDACGSKHIGSSYLCTTCGFWVSQNCASSPSKIKLSKHHHPLSLIYSLPNIPYLDMPECRCCYREVKRTNWVYSCLDCNYYVHVNCAPSQAGFSREFETLAELQDIDFSLIKLFSDDSTVKPDVDPPRDSKAETLPLPKQSMATTSHFIKQMVCTQTKYDEEATEITHISHDHPLFLSNNQTDNVQTEKICNGCARTIKDPFYHCTQCHFYLHQWCAQLPNETHHPCHPEHPLRLITHRTTNHHLYQCVSCGLLSNTFVFACSACEFYLDVNCASLPRTVKHEAHHHALALRQTRSGSCIACDKYLIGFAYVCDSCNLNLCIRCALLPGTISHRYDKHPFKMTYSFVKNEGDEHYCEICERDVETDYWFYRCGICDQSLHTKCLFPVDWNCNVKFGVTLDYENHPHLLACVRKFEIGENSRCGDCGETLGEDDSLAFECLDCDFWVHAFCAMYW
ncbi:uncharacterized protein LOC127789278 [Diospyros lotus]|uniref:uncharacterized protein LOC127789278 n=1 Tax=Diospyros lotus TaxID=55363 RepID=UPI00225A768A|nr:uncharacterized protein LOC127789278 [Diospyros lotus]